MTQERTASGFFDKAAWEEVKRKGDAAIKAYANLDTYDRTVIGQIALFLANEIGGDVDGKQFYLTLGFQCRERSKKFADLTSVQELVAPKSSPGSR